MYTSPNSRNLSNIGSLNGNTTSSTPSLVSSGCGTGATTIGDRTTRPNKRKPYHNAPSGSRKPKKGKRIEYMMGSAQSTDDGHHPILDPGHGIDNCINVATSHPNTPQLRCSEDSSTVISLHTFPRKSGKVLMSNIFLKNFLFATLFLF